MPIMPAPGRSWMPGSEPLRILHCLPQLGVGGAERQLSLLASAQARTGMDVHVALIHEGRNLQRLLDAGVPIHRIVSRGNRDPGIGIRLWRPMRRLDPDIVQTWLPQMDVFGGLAARLDSRPWVLSERSTALAYNRRLKVGTVRTAIGRHADAIVANSPDGVAYWNSRGARSLVRSVVPNAVPIDEIDSAEPIHPLSEVTGGQQRFVLFAGRLAEEKNLPVLLQALAIVTPETGIKALLCGDDRLGGEIQHIVGRLGLGDVVSLLGIRSDLWGLMKTATVLVNPSFYEGNPNVVLEAAAAGVPLVLSDIKAHRDALNAESALFFRTDLPDELAAALREILLDPDAAARRARRARLAAEEHSIERAVEGYNRVYDKVIAERRRCVD